MTVKKTGPKKPRATKTGSGTPAAAGASAKLAKLYKQTPLATAFAGSGLGLAARAGARPMAMGAVSAAAEAALAATTAAAGPAGLGAAGPPALAGLMQLLGYVSVEEALGVVRIVRREFAQQFGLSTRVVEDFIKALEAKAQPQAMALGAGATEPLTFGLAFAPPAQLSPAADSLLTLPGIANVPAGPPAGGIGFAPGQPALGAEEMPASVNLISQLPNPVRNQANRNTCVAHSVLVAYEHYLSVTSGTAYDLSEQFVYWACKQRDGLPATNDSGTFIRAAKEALEQVGACQEADWGYIPNPIPGNPGQGPPPGGALSAASQFIPARVIRVQPSVVDDFKFIVSRGRCVAFGVPIYRSFWNVPAALRTGRIKFFPGEQPIGGHAMCIVGYQDDASEPLLGGGRFIVRNSHGTQVFGADPGNPYGPGHGTVSYSYIAQHGGDFGDIALAFW